MSINFCVSGLVSNISSSTTCFEGYDVSNLIKVRDTIVNKGFIADHYVKPPVSISLKLICNIDISYIIIKTFVGSQRSINFEVFTKTSFGKGKVGSTLDLNNVDFIIFHKFGDEKFPFKLKSSSENTAIIFHSPHKLKNVNEVILTILKTSCSSVPCLGFLEVWGRPSKLVPQETIQFINEKWAKVIEPPAYLEEPSKVPEEVQSNTFVISDESNIPEEFIDPITCEIMLCPMILPSGKIVDSSTLNKFYKAEEEFGRRESDPFTGLPFSDTRKPFLNLVLKSKIDKYLITNSETEDIKKMPRIIGKRPTSSIPGFQPATIEQSPSCSSYHMKNSIISSDKIKSNFSSRNLNDASSFKRTKRSLDDLISDSLNGLPSYLEPKKTIIFKEECHLCSKDSLLFKLPCSHLICRVCLLKISNNTCLKCSVCSKPYSRSEPVRYHNS